MLHLLAAADDDDWQLCWCNGVEPQGQAHTKHQQLCVPAAGPRVPQPDVDVARSRHGHQERLQARSHSTGQTQLKLSLAVLP